MDVTLTTEWQEIDMSPPCYLSNITAVNLQGNAFDLKLKSDHATHNTIEAGQFALDRIYLPSVANVFVKGNAGDVLRLNFVREEV